MFKPTPDTANLVARIVDEDRERPVELGVYPVFFGMRVRAGFVGSVGCEIDWCCGTDQRCLEWAYAVARDVLMLRADAANPFEGVPPHSERKPIILDVEFLLKLCELHKQAGELEIEPLPPINELRECYFKDTEDILEKL